MLRATRRRLGSTVLMAVGLMAILPAMAEAQLFPNRTIKRQREACVNESPFYKQVKQEYYGYFPTCWSKFPDGWKCPCPNPEAPNAAASFVDRPRVKPKFDPSDTDLEPGMDDGRAMPGEAPTADPGLPPLPSGRAPFPMDSRPGSPDQPGADPFIPKDPGATTPPTRPATPPSGRNPGSSSIQPMPSLPDVAPTSVSSENFEPGSMTMAPDATLASNSPSSRPDLGPLPAMPAVNPGVAPIVEEATIGVPSTPVQAPKRRSLISSLFGSSNRQRR